MNACKGKGNTHLLCVLQATVRNVLFLVLRDLDAWCVENDLHLNWTRRPQMARQICTGDGVGNSPLSQR
jgi:hypothetical protein